MLDNYIIVFSEETYKIYPWLILSSVGMWYEVQIYFNVSPKQQKLSWVNNEFCGKNPQV